jgi:hypothetical protein
MVLSAAHAFLLTTCGLWWSGSIVLDVATLSDSRCVLCV